MDESRTRTTLTARIELLERFHEALNRAFNGEASSDDRSFINRNFIVHSLDLAIEVKLAKPGHGAAEIQEEMTADIGACRTKWRHFMVVIYDLGVITDPYHVRTSNQKLFGVSVIVVKH